MLVKNMKNFTKEDFGGFTIITNQVVNNENLSLKSKGLYAYLYSKPNGWNFSAERIAKQNKEGVRTIEKTLNELEENGLLERKKNVDGRMHYHLLANINLSTKIADSKKRSLLKAQSAKSADISNKDNIVIKSNSNKEIIITDQKEKEKIITEINKQIAEVINRFKPVNPNIKFYLKSNRDSAGQLIDKYGYDETLNLVDMAVKASGMDYAPVITTPSELINKIGKLEIFVRRQNSGIKSL